MNSNKSIDKVDVPLMTEEIGKTDKINPNQSLFNTPNKRMNESKKFQENDFENQFEDETKKENTINPGEGEIEFDIKSINEKKLKLNRPRDFFINIYFFIFIVILIICIFFANYFTTQGDLQDINEINNYLKQFLIRIPLVSKLSLIYRMALMKNSPIMTIEGQDLFNQTNDELNQAISKISQLLTSGNLNNFNKTVTLENDLNTVDMCTNLMKYNTKYTLYELYPVDSNTLFAECSIGGNGMNSKGLDNTFKVLMMSLKNLYEDFTTDNARTYESFIKRASSQELVNTVQNLDLILKPIFNAFQNTIIDDVFLFFKTIREKQIIFGVVTIFFVIVTIITYLVFFTIQIKRNNDVLNFIDKVVENAINF